MGNAAQAVTTWFIDPQNTSTTASDAKDGQTSSTALRTWAELVRRWGTLTPILAQVTTVTFLSSHTDNTDPVIATPLLRGGGALIITATLPATSFTGTLNVVTAKNRAANQALQSTFNTTTGAVAANMLLVNTSRSNTRAFAQRNVSGGNWQISQPLNPYSGTGTPSPTQNNAWASGDNINGYVLTAVNVVRIAGQVFDENLASFTGGVVLWQIQVYDPQASNNGIDPLSIFGEAIPFIVEVVCNRSFSLNTRLDLNPQIMNTVLGAGGSLCFTTLMTGASINAGIVMGGVGGLVAYEQCVFSQDIIIGVSGTIALINPVFQNGTFIDLSGAALALTGNSAIQSGAFYGAGKVNCAEGMLTYAGTAVAAFPLSGGLQIGGLTVAYSLNNGTFTPNVSLTAANLDAAAGPNGFKGTAWVPGCTITNGSFAFNAALTQAAWFIDPANSSGTASDTNTGLTSGTALRTWAEVVRRWGTNSPVLRQDVTITFISSHSDDTDPVIFKPIIANQASIVLQGQISATQQLATGTLAGVVAKNRSTPQLLNATLAAGLAAGKLVINATHSSVAWTYKNVSGNTWSLSQPLAPRSVTNFSVQPAMVDTWTNGDTFTVYDPVKVNIVELAPTLEYLNSSTFANFLQVYRLAVYDPVPGDDEIYVRNPSVVFTECTFIRTLVWDASPDDILAFGLVNCDCANDVFGHVGAGSGGYITGGQFRGLFLAKGFRPDANTIFGGTLSHTITSRFIGSIYCESAITTNLAADDGAGLTAITIGAYGSFPVFWGPGTLNVTGNTRLSYPSGQTGAATFLTTGFQIDGGTTAYSLNGITINQSVTLSGANLDNPAGPSGFNGFAWIPGGASIVNGTSTQNTALTQTTWFIDPANSQGTSSDKNTGLASGTALRTYAELVRRWGTLTPIFVNVSVTINWLSSHVDTSDPVIITPILVNGSSLTHKGTLPAASFTGSLLAVTAKSPSGNQALQSTFTTTTGAITADMLLSNTTRASSRAFVQRNISGGTWQLAQPFSLYTGSGAPANTEVDTWANGDAIQGFALPIVNIVRIGGQLVDLNGGFTNSLNIWQISVFDSASAFNFDSLIVDGAQVVEIVDCVIGRSLEWQGFGAISSNITNCSLKGSQQIRGGPGPVSALTINGGIIAGSSLRVTGIVLTKDIILSTTGPVFTDAQINQLFYDTNTVVAQCFGYVKCQGIQYGAGKINEVMGTFDYSAAALTIFPLTGGLQLNGKTTAYSYATSGGVGSGGATTVHNLNLTPTLLDAAAGATGFGGYAQGPGCCFSQTGLQT